MKVYVVIPIHKKADFDYLFSVHESAESAVKYLGRVFQKVVVDKKIKRRSVWIEGSVLDEDGFKEETYWNIKVTDAAFGLNKQKFKIVEREMS